MATDFGKRLVQARKHAKLTQAQLAKAVGVSQATIAEAEKKGYGSSYTYQIATRCGVDPGWLATGDGLMEQSDQAPPVVDFKASDAWPALSPQAHLLGECFDMLVDPTARHRAYNEATAAILAHLPSREPLPSPVHSSTVKARKQRV